LSERGRRNIARMLEIAWHERQLCLVAVEDRRLVRFACARIDAGTGLLPELVGEIDALYVTPQARGGTSSAPAEAAIAELRALGAEVIHNLVCIEDDEAQAFWQAQGSSATWFACRCTEGAEQR
jgi:Acetyltransferase (GNAT) family